MKLEDLPKEDGTFFPLSLRHALKSPLPRRVFRDTEVPPVLDELSFYGGASGTIAEFQPSGPTTTSSNAFFQALGSNGRSCFTCHQPADGMSISIKHINDVFRITGGHDPLFALPDGPTCPNNVPASETSGALVGGAVSTGTGTLADAFKTLLKRGLIRVFNPVPVGADYTIEVVSDPYGCAIVNETDSNGVARQLVSVYRRPRISASMLFAVSAAPPPATPPATPETGNGSGNIMWDGREPFLEHQVIDATEIHGATNTAPTAAQQTQIVNFETGIFSAMTRTHGAGELTARYALGGPVVLASETVGQRSSTPFTLFTTWQRLPKNFDRAAFRESVARGEALFNGTAPNGNATFAISNDSGINKPGQPPITTGHCATCHSQHFDGADSFPSAQQDQGIGGDSANLGGPAPSPFLPIFKVTCKTGSSTDFHGTSVLTNDPGKALISGKCADVSKFTVPQLRALAPRAPYFSDGSAATLLDVVKFYDKRFAIGLSPEDKNDLANFLSSL